MTTLMSTVRLVGESGEACHPAKYLSILAMRGEGGGKKTNSTWCLRVVAQDRFGGSLVFCSIWCPPAKQPSRHPHSLAQLCFCHS